MVPLVGGGRGMGGEDDPRVNPSGTASVGVHANAIARAASGNARAASGNARAASGNARDDYVENINNIYIR